MGCRRFVFAVALICALGAIVAANGDVEGRAVGHGVAWRRVDGGERYDARVQLHGQGDRADAGDPCCIDDSRDGERDDFGERGCQAFVEPDIYADFDFRFYRQGGEPRRQAGLGEVRRCRRWQSCVDGQVRGLHYQLPLANGAFGAVFPPLLEDQENNGNRNGQRS